MHGFGLAQWSAMFAIASAALVWAGIRLARADDEIAPAGPPRWELGTRRCSRGRASVRMAPVATIGSLLDQSGSVGSNSADGRQDDPSVHCGMGVIVDVPSRRCPCSGRTWSPWSCITAGWLCSWSWLTPMLPDRSVALVVHHVLALVGMEQRGVLVHAHDPSFRRRSFLTETATGRGDRPGSDGTWPVAPV